LLCVLRITQGTEGYTRKGKTTRLSGGCFFVAEKNVEQLSLDLQQSQEHNISTEETEQPQILYVQHQQKNNEPLQQHNIEQSSENNDILEPQQSQEHKISTEETEQLQTLYVQPSPQKMERLQYDDLKQMYPDYLIGINIQNFYQFYGKDADIISKQFHREVIKNMGESISLKIPLDLEEIKVLLKKQNIILTDKKEYIPFTNTIELENRPFQFDGINFDTGNVVLRDLEMSGTFPLFREEKISFVREQIEKQMQEIKEKQKASAKQNVDIVKKQPITEKTEKIKSGYFEYLNVVDKYIYCLEKDQEKNQYNLVKMKTNGNKKETIARNVDHSPITATKGKIYYFKDESLYSIKDNGSRSKKISDKKISYYEIDGNMMYYIYENEGESYIAKMKLNGKNNNIRIGKLNDSEYVSLHVKGNKIYYIVKENEKSYKLYKMKKNGEKEERIYSFTEKISNINMQDDAIYYIENDNGYKISTINYKAGNKGTIKKLEKEVDFAIVDKWVVYVTENKDNEIVVKRITTKGEKEQSL